MVTASEALPTVLVPITSYRLFPFTRLAVNVTWCEFGLLAKFVTGLPLSRTWMLEAEVTISTVAHTLIDCDADVYGSEGGLVMVSCGGSCAGPGSCTVVVTCCW